MNKSEVEKYKNHNCKITYESLFLKKHIDAFGFVDLVKNNYVYYHNNTTLFRLPIKHIVNIEVSKIWE